MPEQRFLRRLRPSTLNQDFESCSCEAAVDERRPSANFSSLSPTQLPYIIPYIVPYIVPYITRFNEFMTLNPKPKPVNQHRRLTGTWELTGMKSIL